MSLKSVTLTASLFLILLNNNVWASYSSPDIDADDEIEAAQSIHGMPPLLDLGQAKSSLLFEVGQPSSKKLSMMMLEKVSSTLEQQEITPLIITPLALSLNLIEEYDLLNFAKRLKLDPLASGSVAEVRAILNESSQVEQVQEALSQPQPFYPTYVWDEMLDEAEL